MQNMSIIGLILGALVVVVIALAMSRRSLGIAALLCLLALGVLGYALAEWAHLL